MNPRRVVITGLGCVTSLGQDVEPVWQAVREGRSGIKPITKFDTTDYTTKIGGEVSDWAGGKHLAPREAKRLDRFAQFAVNAAIDAVAHAGLDFEKEDPWRCGAIIGSGVGGIEELAAGHLTLIEKGPDRVSPFMVPKLMCNAGSGNVSIRFGLKGPNSAPTSACASAAHAIGEAAEAIRHNVADVMITGGSEAALTPIGLASFIALKALSKRNDDPTHASRPWDEDRDGFLLSEGAGILVVEEYEHAKARGANVLAEVIGWGQSADGYHITAPDEAGRGAAEAMKLALNDAHINPDDIDYINAHGTSTGLGDLAEARAVKRVFGNPADAPPVSSTKSTTGHLLGASGGIETILCALALRDSVIPPTANLEKPSEECDLDFVPQTAREAPLNTVISNSFGFGGHNVCLVLKKV